MTVLGHRHPVDPGIKVHIDGRYAGSLDGLLAVGPLPVAAVVVNEDWSELDQPDGMFPIVAKDGGDQRERLRTSLSAALTQGAVAVVLPELSAAGETVYDLESVLDETDGPSIVFGGSAHLVHDSRNVNRAEVFLPGVGAAWCHYKMVAFEDRSGQKEGIEVVAPEVTVACGNHVRVAVLICKDALALSHIAVLGDLGVHLLGVPAMSEGLGDFANAAYALVARSQGAMVVANNPRMWEGEPVDTALLGHPVDSHQKTEIGRAEVAPGVSQGRLGTGWH